MKNMNDALEIQHIDGKYIVPPALLEMLMEERDRKVRRIKRATETILRLKMTTSIDEYNSVQIPDDFQIWGKYASMVMMSYVSGFVIADDGTSRCHYGNMGAPASVIFPTLYRGELSDYGTTSGFSLLGRSILINHSTKDIETKYTYFFVDQIKRMVFFNFLNAFRQFREFRFSTPMDGAIAQHYGLNTQFIDLTDDLKVALFFASCKHVGDNQYRPIREDELSTLGKYGVLYEGSNRCAKIIGYQPFCRCHRQRGYYIDTAGAMPCWDFSLSPSTGFHKYYFERTVELSKQLCTEFDGGRVLFPDDGLVPFSSAIHQIKNLKHLPIGAFRLAHQTTLYYLEMHHRNNGINDALYNTMLNQEYWEKQLKKEGFEFCEQTLLNTNLKLIEEMNRQWDPYEYAAKEGINYTPFTVTPYKPKL